MSGFLLWSNAPDGEISPFDRIGLGHGVFDTLKIRDGVLEDGPEHFARLARHAEIFGIPLREDCLDIAQAESARHDLSGLWRLRTLVTAGEGPPGLALPPTMAPRIFMTLAPAPDPHSQPPARAVFSRIRRNESSPLSRIKAIGNYADSILATAEAQKRGANEALFLNGKGCVACATVSNLFAHLDDGTLATPPLEDGAMDGVVRAKFLAQRNAQERSLRPEDLLSARGVFLTNSLIGARAVIEIEGQEIPVIQQDPP